MSTDKTTDKTTQWPGSYWRYQPVYTEDNTGRYYSLCECHLDHNNKLVAWTERAAMDASGNSTEDLRGDLEHMLRDAYMWEPVAFADMCVGMVFVPTGFDVAVHLKRGALMQVIERPLNIQRELEEAKRIASANYQGRSPVEKSGG